MISCKEDNFKNLKMEIEKIKCENKFISVNDSRLCFFVKDENISLVEFQKHLQ